MHDILLMLLKKKLNNNHFSKNAISHKDLKKLLNKAKKETLAIQNSENNEFDKNQELNSLLKGKKYGTHRRNIRNCSSSRGA